MLIDLAIPINVPLKLSIGKLSWSKIPSIVLVTYSYINDDWKEFAVSYYSTRKLVSSFLSNRRSRNHNIHSKSLWKMLDKLAIKATDTWVFGVEMKKIDSQSVRVFFPTPHHLEMGQKNAHIQWIKHIHISGGQASSYPTITKRASEILAPSLPLKTFPQER